MSVIEAFLRKLKKAIGGAEEPVDATRPFDWHPTAVVPSSVESGPAETTDAALPPGVWQKQGEASSVIGATIPADVADFAIVYKGAGVSPPAHGYGIDRVAQMLAHKSLDGLDKAVKASAVLAALDAEGVRIQEVIHDGLLRYKALVAFEAAKELEMLASRPRNERRREHLEQTMAVFQQRKNAEIDALTQLAAARVAALQQLKSRRSAEEDRLYRTVSLFVQALPARVMTMPKPGPAAAPPPNPLETMPELRLVPAAVEAEPAKPQAGQTIAPASEAPKTEEKQPWAESSN
jgi:hypothetical protein